MPPPNLAHLQADPAGLLTWLNGNLLQGGYLVNVPNPPGTAWVTITPSPNNPHAVLTSVQKRGEMSAPVVRPSRAPGALLGVTSLACSSRSPC